MYSVTLYYSFESSPIGFSEYILKESFEERLIQSSIKFMSNMKKKQQILLISYDWLMYFSLFFFIIAFFVVAMKTFSNKKDMLYIKIMNEERLKLNNNLQNCIANDLENLKSNIDNNDVANISSQIEQVSKGVNCFIESLKIELTEDFKTCFENLFIKFEKNHNIKTVYSIESRNFQNMSVAWNVKFFKIIQEMLCLISLYDDVSEISIHIYDTATGIKLIVNDDGSVFSPKDVIFKNAVNSKVGCSFKSFYEHISSLGGFIDFLDSAGNSMAIYFQNLY